MPHNNEEETFDPALLGLLGQYDDYDDALLDLLHQAQAFIIQYKMAIEPTEDMPSLSADTASGLIVNMMRNVDLKFAEIDQITKYFFGPQDQESKYQPLLQNFDPIDDCWKQFTDQKYIDEFNTIQGIIASVIRDLTKPLLDRTPLAAAEYKKARVKQISPDTVAPELKLARTVVWSPVIVEEWKVTDETAGTSQTPSNNSELPFVQRTFKPIC